MREIKFRGFGIFEWVYGSLVRDGDKRYIVEEIEISNNHGDGTDLYATIWSEVTPESVGEYTGLNDLNGKEIYEGDIVKYTSNEQIGTRGNYKKSYSIYEDVEIVGQVKFEEEHLQYYVNTYSSTSYDSYFFADSKNQGARTIKNNLSKPLVNKKKYEVIGNIYQNKELLQS